MHKVASTGEMQRISRASASPLNSPRSMSPAPALSRARTASPSPAPSRHRGKTLSCEALPGFEFAMVADELSARMSQIVTSEVQLEATLHVPAAQANACLSAYGLTANDIQQAPSLVSQSTSHLLTEDATQDMKLASCLATPMESTSAQNPLRGAAQGAVATRSMQQLSGAHESVSIVDRYGDWARRMRRRRRMESVQAMLGGQAAVRPEQALSKEALDALPKINTQGHTTSLESGSGALAAASALGLPPMLQEQPSLRFGVVPADLEAAHRPPSSAGMLMQQPSFSFDSMGFRRMSVSGL